MNNNTTRSSSASFRSLSTPQGARDLYPFRQLTHSPGAGYHLPGREGEATHDVSYYMLGCSHPAQLLLLHPVAHAHAHAHATRIAAGAKSHGASDARRLPRKPPP